MPFAKNHFVPFHFHSHHWDMNIIEFYLFQSMFMIAFSMINLFVPIYLISDVGYPLWGVITFFLITQIFFISSLPFSGKVIKYFGVKHSIVLQLPFYAIYYIGLQYLSGNFVSDLAILIPIIGLRAFFGSNGNVARDIFMSKNILKKNTGTMLAWWRIVIVAATVISPFIGGLVSYFYGFDKLFWIAIVITLFSGLPLLLTSDKHFNINYKPQQLFSFIRHKADKNYLIAEAGNILSDTMMWIMWPLFLFFALKNTADLGKLITMSAAISMGIAYFVGKKVDTSNPANLLINGVRISSGLFLLRAISLNPFIIGIIDAFNKIIDPIFRIPYDRAAYKIIMENHDQVKMANIKQLITEIYYTIGVLILLMVVLVVPEVSVKLFITLFVVFAFIMLLMQKMANIKFKSDDKQAVLIVEKENMIIEELKILEERNKNFEINN